MQYEDWGALSIYDFRRPIFRQALVLFDRVVIPVPKQPVTNMKGKTTITEEALIELSAAVEKLVAAGAAIKVDWDKEEFFKNLGWADLRDVKRGKIKNLLAEGFYNALLEEASGTQAAKDASERLKERGLEDLTGKNITTTPVYETRIDYENNSIGREKQLVLQIIMRQIPVPAIETPLDDIIKLRQKKSFQDSMRALRMWKNERVIELLETKDEKLTEALVEKAYLDLESRIRKYSEAMNEANFRKITTGIVSVLGIGGILLGGPAILLGGPAAIFLALEKLGKSSISFSTALKPSWRTVNDAKDGLFAPAGVIFQAGLR